MSQSVLIKSQKKTYGKREIAQQEGYGRFATLTVSIRYDDQCGNGHNTFSITSEVRDSVGTMQAGGCCHDLVAKYFPELAKYIKWHLCSSDGPLHYIANTTHLAGDKDCWGLRQGEFRQMKDRATGKLLWRLEVSYDQYRGTVAADETPEPLVVKYVPYGQTGKDRETGKPLWRLEVSYDQYRGTVAADETPEPLVVKYVPYGQTGKGKERELDAARKSAIWPDATDEDLTAPGLEDRLKARLPALLEEFRHDMEELGFVF